MKQLSLFIILAFLVSSCAAATTIGKPAPPQSLTIISAITHIPTLISTPTLTPSATLEASSLIFDIASNVPAKDAASIRRGIDYARVYLRDYLGGDIRPDKQNFTVKIIADGKGNEGSCCTALAESGPRPFFDVLHPIWLNLVEESRLSPGAHEYTHAWQSSLGCMTIHSQPLDNWLTEGIAEYVAINALRNGGYITEGEYSEMLNFKFSNSRSEDLSIYERRSSNQIYDLGFVALDKLVSLAPTGELSLRAVCEDIALGKSADESFQDAFGISKKDFYTLFAEFQTTYATPTPEGGVAVSGHFVFSDDITDPAQVGISFCKTRQDPCDLFPGSVNADGTFSGAVPPGSYFIIISPSSNGEIFGWFSRKGLVTDLSCADSINVLAGKELNLTIDLHPTNICH